MTMGQGVAALAERLQQEVNTLRSEMASPRVWHFNLNARFFGDRNEVNSFNASYGPGYGNNSSDMGDYPLNFTSQPHNKTQGYGVPWRCKITGFKTWKYVNNTALVHRILIWKQKRFEGLSTEDPTLLYESPEITAATTNPYWFELTESDFNSNDIAHDDHIAVGVARIDQGTTRYYTYMLNGLLSIEEIK